MEIDKDENRFKVIWDAQLKKYFINIQFIDKNEQARLTEYRE